MSIRSTEFLMYITFNDFIDLALIKQSNGDETYLIHILDLYLREFLEIKGDNDGI